MNATVAKIVELLFQNTEMTQEAQAMRDELMTNCQDRFDDLVAHGKSEDDAISGVIESLKGMEDVIDAYPKKPEPTFFNPEGESFPEDDDDEDERVIRIDANGLNLIAYDMPGGDLTVDTHMGSDVLVRYDRDDGDNIDVRREGDTLRVSFTGDAQHRGPASVRASLDLNDLFGSFRSLFKGWMGELSCPDVTISVPYGLALRLDARTVGGDMEIDGVKLSSASVVTTSGDVELRTPMEHQMDELKLTTASGDIDLRANARSIRLKSMSGDVEGACACERLEAGSVSGDVDLDASCETAAIKSVSGEVRLRCDSREPKEIAVASTSGDVYVRLPANTSAVSVKTQTVSGSVRQSVPSGYGENAVRVKAQTVSGDITVVKAR